MYGRVKSGADRQSKRNFMLHYYVTLMRNMSRLMMACST